MTVAHAEARSSVEAQLHGVALQRFDSRLHLWVTPEFEPERIRELGASAWLLEVGVEADPCAGPGMLARLHLSDDIAAEAIAAGFTPDDELDWLDERESVDDPRAGR